ncbi:MAG TPA: hypothetical protein VKV95_09380 [Terriglobia bacterium]|nr:hypothetical protein [Terriglobia bacterium]
MTRPSNFHGRILITAVAFTLAVLLAPQTGRARDKEFGMLVHYVESHYRAHRQYRFLMGFASLTVNIVRPYGVKGMKLALWENGKIKGTKDDMDFPAVVKAGLADGWQPMVRVWSRRDGERTVIFAKPEGKDMKLLVATVDEEDAVVVEVKINPDKLSRCIDQWSRNDRHDRHGEKNIDKPSNPTPHNGDESEIDSM